MLEEKVLKEKVLEEKAIQIQYFLKSKVPAAISALKRRNRRPLLLLEHAQQHKMLSVTEQPFIHLHSGLDSIISEHGRSGDDRWCELWTAKGSWKQGKQAIKTGSGEAISYCFNEDFLIGSLAIQLSSEYSLQELSETCYGQIIDFIGTQGKPHLLRMWNYFPYINQLDNNLERYQQFCIGRHQAFVGKAIRYPAASAVGSYSSVMVIVFIATAQAGLFVENPEQLSAYHYPSYYSPKSPSFSRASVYQNSVTSQLYISGTASIVGHESKFHGDIIGQTLQTIKNLNRLIQYTNDQETIEKPFNSSDTTVDPPAIKVYLRNPADLAIVAPLIEEFSPNCSNICYLTADICRQELDIEIEMQLNI